MHIASVHILCMGWIIIVHTLKCIVDVHLFSFLFNILAWGFMSKLLMKLQPPKKFKYKYLFGGKILKGDGASSSHIHDNVIFHVPFAVEHQCEVMDLVLALIKKIKKAYDMKKHFQDTWVIKLPWGKNIFGSNGKVVQVRCKVYSLINGKYKLLVAKLDSLWKHVGCHKALVAMQGVKVGEQYFLKSNADVANEKFFFAKGSKIVL